MRQLQLSLGAVMKGRVANCLLPILVGCASSASNSSVSPPASPPANPADSAHVEVLSLASNVFGNTRALHVYLPPGYDAGSNSQRRYPVLYMNDGFALFRHVRAAAIADSLIRAGDLRAIIYRRHRQRGFHSWYAESRGGARD